MKEKKKLLAVLGAAFVCLLGLWGLLLATDKKEDGTGESGEKTACASGDESGCGESSGAGNSSGTDMGTDTDAGAEDTVCVLCDFAPDEIEKLEIRNETADYTILPAAKASQEGAEDTGFLLVGFEKYRQDQGALNRVARLFASVSAKRIYERDFEKDKFGLQDPCAMVTISGQEEEVVFYLGSQNESASVWYAMKEGDESLYCLDKGIGEQMTASPYTLLDRTLLPALDLASEQAAYFERIRVERPDLEAPLEIVASTEQAAAYTSAYELTSPISVKVSLKTEREQIASLPGLSAKKALGVYDPAKTSGYGLERPSMVMTVVCNGAETKLTVGDIAAGSESAERYLLCSDTDLLYIIEENSLPFFDETADDLFFGMALLPKIAEVEEVYLNLQGEEYLFSLVFETAEEETRSEFTEGRPTETGEPQGETLRALLDGEELEESLFRKFYSFLLEVDAEKINQDNHAGVPALTIEYRYRDGGADRLEAFLLEDTRRMGITVNGKPSFEGRSAYLEKLRTELSHLLAGEEIDTNW